MSFYLGKTSEAHLIGVQPKLVCCVRYSIKRTPVDFGVFEGLRSIERQRVLYASGASRTPDSYHLDGFAVDLVPFIEGRLQWQASLCVEVARTMLFASRDLSVRLVWGGVWDRELASLDPEDLPGAVEAYRIRYRASHPPRKLPDGRLVPANPLIDKPHFQLVRGQ